MGSRGETVKYVIDADTSGFARGMAEAALESDVAGRQIDRNLSRTAKRSENNFADIRRSAATAGSQIRNFGLAMQGFNVTTLIIGVTALTGAIIELSGALAAAGATLSILPAISLQVTAGMETLKTGVFGLDKAFKAIQKNDGKAFQEALQNLGPAATEVAYAIGGLNKAFNSIRLNTQQALLSGLGDVMLHLGAVILPTINAGMQIVGRAMNSAAKQAANLAETPLFQGLLATVFNDTARNVSILSEALGPLLSIFTNLYIVTRPYVTLLAQSVVTLTKNAAAYLSSAKGQFALNLAIQEGLVALKLLGSLVGAVFGLLTSVFRTSVNAGNSLLPTLTSIIRSMQDWVNSAKGQSQLIALFQLTSLTLQAMANTIGRALTFFFGIIDAFSSLNPALQQFIVSALAGSFITRYFVSYISKLYLSFRVLAVTLFNVVEQAIVVFSALGLAASIVLVLAGALIVLGAIIRGPLGGALIIIGTAIALYVALSYLATSASVAAAEAFYEKGVAALYSAEADGVASELNILVATTMYNTAAAAAAAGGGMTFAARAASFLSTALLGIVVAAAGVVVILSMLGVFGGGSKKAAKATDGFSSSLGSLQKAMKGVGTTGANTSTNGLSALNDSLGQVGQTADTTTDSLASFDKMNVLTDNNAGANAGIPGLPSLPNLGTPSLGAPTIDTGNFDKALEDMQKNFNGLQKNLAKPLANPFDSIGKWLNKHPWVTIVGGIALAILGVVAALTLFGVISTLTFLPVSILLALVVAGVVALIIIGISLWKNWDKIWAGIKSGASATWQFLQGVWDGIVNGVKAAAEWVGGVFGAAWDVIKAVWNVVVDFFEAIFAAIGDAISFYVGLYVQAFQLAWGGIKAIWNVAVGFFQNVWNGIVNIFNAVSGFFGGVFSNAWNGIKNAFSAVGSFFQGVWNTIVGIFSGVGTTIGNAISGAFKSVVNTAISWIADMINGVIRAINGAIGIINRIPRVKIQTIGEISLPRLAKGGIITAPTVAQLGENGQEAVMPLENNTEWIDKLAAKINASNNPDPNSNNTHIPSRLDAPQQAPNITIQVSGVFATSVAEQRKVADIIAKRINESMKTKAAGAF